jgi:hypothetical protein
VSLQYFSEDQVASLTPFIESHGALKKLEIALPLVELLTSPHNFWAVECGWNVVLATWNSKARDRRHYHRSLNSDRVVSDAKVLIWLELLRKAFHTRFPYILSFDALHYSWLMDHVVEVLKLWNAQLGQS